MKKIFAIEDEVHAEPKGEFGSFTEAIKELGKWKHIPWNKRPHLCPCISRKKCGRLYSIIEYDISVKPWRERSRKAVLSVSAAGMRWILP